MTLITDQFDAAAQWLVTHLATWETQRRGFSTVESPEDNQTRVGMIATFLRHDFWNQPDGSLPHFGEPFVLPGA
jgi:hypothetical protein